MTLDLTRRRRALVYGLLCLLALVPRLLPPNLALWDESLWLGRATNFMDALAAGDWAATAQSYHPGVMTMWLGGLGIRLAQALGLTPSVTSWPLMIPLALAHTVTLYGLDYAYIYETSASVTVSSAAATAALQPDDAGETRLTLYGAECAVSYPLLGSWSAAEIAALAPAAGERFRLAGLVPGWDPYLTCATIEGGQDCALTLNTPFASDALTARVMLPQLGEIMLTSSGD